MATCKSAIKVSRLALSVADKVLPRYSHPNSPHKFTQAQLFCCLVLKDFFHLDFRALVELLASSAELRATIGLSRLPHYSTVAKAGYRLLSAENVRALLDEVLRRAKKVGELAPTVALTAIDSSGFDASSASKYFVTKRDHQTGARRQRLSCPHYPTLGILVDCRSHLILAAVVGVGPWPEIGTLAPLVRQARRRVKVHTLLADKAYDSEASHRVAHEKFGVVRTIIRLRRSSPLQKGRPGPTTPYRRQMGRHPHRRLYGQRWQVESVYSMLKRRLGSTLSGRSARERSHQLLARALYFDLLLL
jgi:hypothetical protein